jgi:transcriptional regulator with XRE-family HTH domain
MMPSFAERLRELRKQAGVTQAQLAERSGIPLGSIRNYEQGQREPYWNVAFRLATALGVSVEAFADCVAPTEQRSSTGTSCLVMENGAALVRAR